MNLREIALIVNLFLFNGLVYSQGLTGGYILESEKSKEAYYFHDDGEFSWFKFTSGSKKFGEGTFVLDGDSIKLNFGKVSYKFGLKSDLHSTRVPNFSGKHVVQVNAVTSGGVRIKGLRSTLKKSSIILVTDSSGYSNAEIVNPGSNDEIRFEVEGHEDYGTIDTSVELRGYNNYFQIVIDDDVSFREYEIISLGLMKSNKSVKIKQDDQSNEFKKISKNRYLNLYHRVKE